MTSNSVDRPNTHNARPTPPTQITKVLIANRGEIAVRIASAATEAGLSSVAIYADQDANALHVRRATEAYGLGGSTPRETYLDITKILAIAAKSGADAVHPGYGFLAESAEFARAVIDAGFAWIGPNPETIELLGDKARARALAASVGAPLVPGTNTPVTGAADVESFAAEHGLPVAIKAVHGGGGRGIRVVRDAALITEAYDAAVREAETAFGQGDCLVERFLDRPRHIEAQVLGDQHGRIAVLGTRDCSLQRRNQKLVEEAPAPFISDELRDRIHQSAHDICAAANYVGAGTVEFLLGEDGTLTFLEVNTRLQVEHPITEAVTGIDIVQQQLRIAAGLPMTVPEHIPTFGHALEFRINAEDPALGFLPTPGTLTRFDAPGGQGVRIDTGFAAGQTIPGTFDSLIAKLIVWGANREEALARARRALNEFEIDGVATVLPFDRYVVTDPAFTAEGDAAFAVHTRWIEEECTADFTAAPAVPTPAEQTMTRVPIEIDGKLVELGLPGALLARLTTAGETAPHRADGRDAAADPHPKNTHTTDGAIAAPFAGHLNSWQVADGAQVEEGDTVAILEAMKMEVPVKAPRAGKLQQLIEAGATVDALEAIGKVEIS